MWRWVIRILWGKRGPQWFGTTAAVVLVVGAAMGWRVREATDPARVEPVALPTDLDLEDGDIILAGGVSLQSRAVMSLVGGQRYSHVGLIEQSDDGLMVLHASPRGAGDGGVGDRVARLPLAVFLSERGYVAVRVLRLSPDALAEAHGGWLSQADGPSITNEVAREGVDPSQIAGRAATIAGRWADQAVPFDHRYDLAEQDALYCSELVWLAYREAGLGWPDTLFSSPSLTRADGPVILPGSFAEDSRFRTIWDSSPNATP